LKIIHRYVLRETLPLFGLCLAVFTFILLINKVLGLLDLVLNKGVPAGEALMLYLNIIPIFLSMTVPMAVLVSVLLALGRLGTDLEITALKGNGVHIIHVVAPLVGFGVLATVLMLFFNDRILPASNYSFKQRTFRIVQQKANVAIKERVFIDAFQGYEFYIDQQDSNGTLEGLRIFSKPSPESSWWSTAAKTGHLKTDPKTMEVSLILQDGYNTFLSPGQPEGFNRIFFKRQTLRLTLGNQLAQMGEIQKDYLDMDLAELRRATALTAPSDGERLRRLKSEYQKRLSLPFACLAVTWFGAPLGLMFRRRGFIAFTFGIGMIFVYYLIFVLGEVSSLKGSLHPAVGLWMANAAFLIVGWFLYRLASQERQAFRFDRPGKGAR